MTSENVIVSIKLCPEVGNGESIVDVILVAIGWEVLKF